MGILEVNVYPSPKIAVLSTGDELVDPYDVVGLPGDSIGYGMIRDSNRSMLFSALKQAGISDVLDLGIARDVKGDLLAKVQRGIDEADILITSGGVSMGELDLLKPTLEKQGKIHFGRVLMKPGKPLTFATVDSRARRKYVFSVPGNPVSALVCFHLTVVPAIRKLSGWPTPNLPRVRATLLNSIRLDPERPEYHRALIRFDLEEGVFKAESTGRQASSRLASMRSANALLELPRADTTLEVGHVVTAYIISSSSET